MTTVADHLALFRPTAVYRFYDGLGRLLYVGITFDLGARFKQHERKATWWGQQRSVRIIWRDTRSEAAAEERVAIRDEKPLHNIAGKRVRPIRSGRVRADPAKREAIAREVRGELARYRTPRREVRALLGLSNQSIGQRMSGRIPFRIEELEAIADMLDLPVSVFTHAAVAA